MQIDQELNKIQLESVMSHNFFENLMWPRFLKTAVTLIQAHLCILGSVEQMKC